MGGFGSGRWRWRTRRQVVERCLHVTTSDLPYVVMPSQEIALPIRRHDGQIAAMLPCRTLRLDDGALALGFKIPAGDEILALPLGNTPAPSGGSRLCFLCPIALGDSYCGQLSRKLYAPPGAKFLGCRQCHRLSYSSSQKRKQRLARADIEADKLIECGKVFVARAKQGRTDFDENLHFIRRLSHTIRDLIESLG